MREKNLFDILGNAEDDSMERLTDKCPEITDAQLDRLLAMSERKYKMKKKDTETNRTEKDNDITMSETVSGVERSRRPVWFTPLCTAASLILVAGIIFGGASLFRRHGKGGGDVVTPAVTVTTTSGTDTTMITTTVTANGTATTAADNNAKCTTETGKTSAVTTTAAKDNNNSGSGNHGNDGSGTSGNTATSNDQEYADIAKDIYRNYNEMVIFCYFMSKAELDKSDYIWFMADPDTPYYTIDLSSDDPEYNCGESDKVFFARVTDSLFNSLDDIKKHVRKVFSTNSEEYKKLFDLCSDDMDGIEIGGRLNSEQTNYRYIEYKGELYASVADVNAGWIWESIFEEEPIIIADKTDHSFTAFFSCIPTYPTGKKEHDYREARKVKFVLDSETGNWCMDEVTYLDYDVYLKIAAEHNG